jgi:hypothetical protein
LIDRYSIPPIKDAGKAFLRLRTPNNPDSISSMLCNVLRHL